MYIYWNIWVKKKRRMQLRQAQNTTFSKYISWISLPTYISKYAPYFHDLWSRLEGKIGDLPQYQQLPYLFPSLNLPRPGIWITEIPALSARGLIHSVTALFHRHETKYMKLENWRLCYIHIMYICMYKYRPFPNLPKPHSQWAQTLFIHISCRKELTVFPNSDTIPDTRKAIVKVHAATTNVATTNPPFQWISPYGSTIWIFKSCRCNFKNA